MEIIALPIVGNMFSSHFGQASHFAIYHIEDKKLIKTEKHQVPAHEPGSFPRWLSEFGVHKVLVGGVGQKAISIFEQNNINVIMGIGKENPDEIVQDYIDGKIESAGNACSH